MGSSIVDGCLESKGFFQLRHLIAVSYIFIISLISILFLMFLFLCNVKCFDEQLGQGRLCFIDQFFCWWWRCQCKVRRERKTGVDWKKPTNIAYEAVSTVLDRRNTIDEVFSCCCYCLEFDTCCTIGVYLKLLLG